MTVSVQADPKHLSVWSGSGAAFGRLDYRTDEYRLSDMLNDSFFGLCWAMLKDGDFITVIDCEDQIMTIRVDRVERNTRKVFISRIERLYAMPAVELKTELPDDPGLVYRFRPTKSGGHSIVTAQGELFAINFETRTDAERAIARCYEDQSFAVPAGHEPVEPYVSPNAKIYRSKVS